MDIVEKYIGKKVDYFLINNGKIPRGAYKRYIEKGEHIIEDDITEKNFKGKVIRTDLVASGLIKREKGDELERSLVRHDSEKIKRELRKIFSSSQTVVERLLGKFFSYYKD